MTPHAPTLIVAGLSVRALAQAAAREGWQVLGIDAFGDADTRAACADWRPIGPPGSLHIDAQALEAALQAWQGRPGLRGWIAGPGLEAAPAALARAATLLPPLGMRAAAIARLRDPAHWTSTLQTLGLPHPPTLPDALAEAPPDRRGWLLKAACGSGGWQVRRALRGRGQDGPARRPRPGDCWQRERPGRAASLLYVADGRQARVVAAQWQRSRALRGRPWVFDGLIGPVRLPGAAQAAAETALQALVPAFGLIGLGSLDLLVDGEAIELLEINPRASASLGLYPELPLIAAHLAACARAAGLDAPCPLPAGPRTAAEAQGLSLRGSGLVEAPRPFVLSAGRATTLARWPGTHDHPMPGSRHGRGDPVCSLQLAATDEATLQAALEQGRHALQALLCAAEAPGPARPAPAGLAAGLATA